MTAPFRNSVDPARRRSAQNRFLGPALAIWISWLPLALGQPAVIDVGRERQLFVDDALIGSMTNLVRHVNPIHKLGRPIVAPDEAWEGTALQFGGVLRDPADGLFKMWYSTFALAASGKAPGWRQCYAESRDGIHWVKPDLGLVEFKGDTHNNLVGNSRTDNSSTPLGYVMLDPRPEERERRFKSFGMSGAGYGVAFSADGKNWKAFETNPVCEATGDVAPTMFDEVRNEFVSYMKLSVPVAGRERRSVGRRTSPDLIRWTANQPILVPDAWEDERAKVMMATRKGWMEYYGMIGFPYEGTYLGLVWSFFCNAERVATTEGVFQVELASSRDGVKWEHSADRAPVIARGTPGSFDGGMVFTAARPIVVKDELWLYYCGWESSHGCYWYEEPKTDEPLKRGFISMGKLRLDGWVSVDAEETDGQLVTRPLRFTGDQLLLNADATHGSVTVAVLDAAGQEIPGLGEAQCVPLQQRSELRWPMTWQGQSKLSGAQAQPVRLRFSLRNAKLYSFQFASK